MVLSIVVWFVETAELDFIFQTGFTKTRVILESKTKQSRALTWTCCECEAEVPITEVLDILREAESLVRNNIGGSMPDIEILEHTLWTLERLVHSNHFLMAQVFFNYII